MRHWTENDEKRANRLLRSTLTKAELKMLDEHGYIDLEVDSHSARGGDLVLWRLRPKRIFSKRRTDGAWSNFKERGLFCDEYVIRGTPPSDRFLGVYLAVKHDPVGSDLLACETARW